MKFKKPELLAEIDVIPKMLYFMAQEFERLSLKCGVEPVVTRIFEAVEGESGVHLCGRAIDFRDFYDGKYLYDKAQREYLLKEMNRLFPRNDGKDTLIHHSFNGMPEHFHLQLGSTPLVYSQMFVLQDPSPPSPVPLAS